jgi:TnpA family transposase
LRGRQAASVAGDRRLTMAGSPSVVSADELAEFFFDERDRRLIGRRRRDANRLGFAVQLGTVRYLGRFLEDPAAVPDLVVRFVARELEIPTVSLAGYAAGKPRGRIRPRSARSTATASSAMQVSSSS